MKNKKAWIVGAIAVIIIAVVVVFVNGTKNQETAEIKDKDKLQIVVTGFPEYDFARAVAKDDADITMLLKPGAEMHTYDPTPKDIKKIKECDLFIYTGGENDEWVKDILASAPKVKSLKFVDCVKLVEEDETVGLELKEPEEHEHNHDHEDADAHEHEHEDADAHEHEHEDADAENHEHEHEDADEHGHKHDSGEVEYDEHVWTSPKNAVKIIKEINTTLCEIEPEYKDTFTKNAEDYEKQINDIDAQMWDIVKNAKRKTLVFGDRFPFRYFTDEFGLEYKAAFPGCSDEMEPSAEKISYLSNYIKEEKIPVILYIELSNQDIANTLAKETGAKTMCLNASHNISLEEFNEGKTYVQILKENIPTLKAALQ